MRSPGVQARTAFSVWRVERSDLNWMGRVKVLEQANGRPVRRIGGIEAYGGQFGAFTDGVVIVQDQTNDGAPNLKFVDWTDVRRALNF